MPLERENVVYPCLVFMDVTIKSAESAAEESTGAVATALRAFAKAMRGERKGMEDIFFQAMQQTERERAPVQEPPITGPVDAGSIEPPEGPTITDNETRRVQ
jgi:hypothetical protein